MRPDSYHELNGCHNCRHALRRTSPDGAGGLYCVRGDVGPRPPTSLEAHIEIMSRPWLPDGVESVNDLPEQEADRLSAEIDAAFIQAGDNLDAWERPREVETFGGCAEHEPGEQERIQ